MDLVQVLRSAARKTGLRGIVPTKVRPPQKPSPGAGDPAELRVSDTASIPEAALRRQLRDDFDRLGHQLLDEVLRRKRVNVVLDIGANRGQFAEVLRATGYTGRIVSFEPVSSNLGPLRRAAERDPDWLVEGYALGEAEEEAEITVSGGPGKLSSLLRGNDYGRDRFENMREDAVRSEAIQIRRLDAVYETLVADVENPRVFIKMDTQGFDLKAWAGAGDLTRSFVGLLSELSCIPIYEGMPHLTEQYVTYEDAGYVAVGMTPVTRDRKSLAVIEFDLLMVRRPSSLKD